jgi:tripartite-type tricarboxylate transporter receptor subunit TctC
MSKIQSGWTAPSRRRVVGYLAAGIAAPAVLRIGPAIAAYPERPIRIIVANTPGGPSDIIARIMAAAMTEAMGGKSVFVENKGGAGGNIGMGLAARSDPDGYTILLTTSAYVINPGLYEKLPYDPFKDFVPITQTTQSMSVLAVRASDGPKTVKELIAQAKAAPGKLNYGGGTLTPQLMGYVFNKAAGIEVQYVPFRGTPATVQGLLTHSVDMVYAATSIALPLVADGKLRALARLDSREFAGVKGIPTLGEAAGLTDFDDLSVWLGLVAPKATPKPIVDKIYREVVHILNDPPTKERIDRSGNYVNTSKSPEAFDAFIRREAARWSKVLPETGIHYD